MNNYYPQIIGIVDKLNELNEKVNSYLDGKIDNAFAGTLIIGFIIAISFWGIRELTKK